MSKITDERLALDRLLTYGRRESDGTNEGTLFLFEGGRHFFLSDRDAQSLRAQGGVAGQVAFNAVLSCPHEIDYDRVILKVDHSKEGNALAQLHARLSSLEASPAPMPHHRLTQVRAHKHTCANVQPGSTYADKCDCGALDTAGNAIEVTSPAPVSEEMVDPSFPGALSDHEVRIWISACNHEPARQALRQLLAYRVRGVCASLAAKGGSETWGA